MCLALIVGVVLWGSYAQRFNDQGKLSYEPNVACIKGSPYGKVLALALQGPIDFYWHMGASHEHTAELNGGHGHDHGDDCDHCHGNGHSHDGNHNHGAGHDFEVVHGDGAVDVQPAEAQVVEQDNGPLRERAKKMMRRMEATAHRRTDSKPMTPAHPPGRRMASKSCLSPTGMEMRIFMSSMPMAPAKGS